MVVDSSVKYSDCERVNSTNPLSIEMASPPLGLQKYTHDGSECAVARDQSSRCPRSLLSEAIECAGSRNPAVSAGIPPIATPIMNGHRTWDRRMVVGTPTQSVAASVQESEWGFHTGNNWTPSTTTDSRVSRGIDAVLGGLNASSSPPLSCSAQSSYKSASTAPPPQLRRVDRNLDIGVLESRSARTSTKCSFETLSAKREESAIADPNPMLSPVVSLEGPHLKRQPHVAFEPFRKTEEGSRRQKISQLDPPEREMSPSVDDATFLSTASLPSRSNAVQVAPPVNIAPKGEPLTLSKIRTPPVVRGSAETKGTFHSSLSVGHLPDPRRSLRRRCMSTKDLGVSIPLSSSPPTLRYRKEMIEISMQQRLMSLRESSKTIEAAMTPRNISENDHPSSEMNQITSETRITNDERNKRRAEHNKAIVNDLCDIVADLFLAESKLVNFAAGKCAKESIQSDVHTFVTSLPMRYALGVENPSQVLVHMRLMAAVRADNTKAAVHIVNMESPSASVAADRTVENYAQQARQLRMVTVSCADGIGLLEYLTKLLSTGGSRVLDADVMLTKDNIVLDRFLVEMNGRLRLDRLQQYIEGYLEEQRARVTADCSGTSSSSGEVPPEVQSAVIDVGQIVPPTRPPGPVPSPRAYGSVYFNPLSHSSCDQAMRRNLQQEIQAAVPLSRVLSTSDHRHTGSGLSIALASHNASNNAPYFSETPIPSNIGDESYVNTLSEDGRQAAGAGSSETRSSGRDNGTARSRSHQALINRSAVPAFEGVEDRAFQFDGTPSQANSFDEAILEEPTMHFIPLDELMIIQLLGQGRISSVYRAAWQQSSGLSLGEPVEVALKVASLGSDGTGAENLIELEREAEIAAHLTHKNVCKLVGVASETECFCLAYEYCAGGTLAALLASPGRCYEYLPIALDIASAMAYLHSMNVVHRDLKPSNILLTKDHRAKVSDFGMSVANTGQELTAETGTYRWMAPEVIRHESYSSNADVYSFGLVLWQLVTREIPFATKSPVQAAYAVAEGYRPEIPSYTPDAVRRIIEACWDEDQYRRPSFTYITLALADYAKLAFNSANVGIQTVRIAEEMLANVEGNSTVNVDSSAPVGHARPRSLSSPTLEISAYGNYAQSRDRFIPQGPGSYNNNVGLEI